MEILVSEDDPVFSRGFVEDSGKIPVFRDDRREGSPSSALVTLLRRDAHDERGHLVGHPAFFFVRIEKVGNKYVPWRGPPGHPQPPGGGASSSVSF